MGQYKRGFDSEQDYHRIRKRNMTWAQLYTYHGVSQRELAEKAGMSVSRVCEAIRGVKEYYNGRIPFLERAVECRENHLETVTAPDCNTQG